MNIYDELIERNLIAQTTNKNEIEELINNGKAIFYVGIDPTADSLHVGHLLTIIFILHLKKTNNKAIILLGGGTGCIGDPTDRNDMRKILKKNEIKHNYESIKKQIKKLVKDKNIKVLNNKDWLTKLNYIDILRDVGMHFHVKDMLNAECYKQRMINGLTFLEFNYMIMQAYDFYYLFNKYKCNLQIGGNDQWSNMLAGIKLIYKKEKKIVYGLTINLLLNSNGEKIGKTKKGAIWLDSKKTSYFDFYQYWRNVNDKDVFDYLKMLTFIPIKEIEEYKKANVNNAKEKLAYELTKFVHGENIAEEIMLTTKNLFKYKNNKENNIPTININITKDINIVEMLTLTKICVSKSESRRLIEQNGLMVNGKKVNDINLILDLKILKEGITIKKGKKNFFKIVSKS